MLINLSGGCVAEWSHRREGGWARDGIRHNSKSEFYVKEEEEVFCVMLSRGALNILLLVGGRKVALSGEVAVFMLFYRSLFYYRGGSKIVCEINS